VFTNGEVRNFILAQAREWWNAAVNAYFVTKDKFEGSRYLGHIQHMIHDSFMEGHTLRTDLQQLLPAAMPALFTNNLAAHNELADVWKGVREGTPNNMGPECGKILYFQGGAAQRNAAAPDKAGNSDRRKQCERLVPYYVPLFVLTFDQCAASSGVTDKSCSWDAVAPLLKDIFALEDRVTTEKRITVVVDKKMETTNEKLMNVSVADIVAGGALYGFHNRDSLGLKSVKINNKLNVLVPTSTRRSTDADVTGKTLCPPAMHARDHENKLQPFKEYLPITLPAAAV